MSSEAVSQYVVDFFKRLLFQEDDSVAVAALEELTSDALIVINGNVVPREVIAAHITGQFRASSSAAFVSSNEINFSPAPGGGCVAQTTKYTTTNKADGATSKHISTTLVTVGEKDGKKVILQMLEVRSEGA